MNSRDERSLIMEPPRGSVAHCVSSSQIPNSPRCSASHGAASGIRRSLRELLPNPELTAMLRIAWSRLGDLNPGPTHYECVALPLS